MRVAGRRGRGRVFDGSVAVVTGAASGIGAACARELAARGARVAVADLDLEAATLVAKDCEGPGRTALAASCDVRRPEELRALRERVESELGPADLVFANAGVSLRGAFADVPAEDWAWLLQTNLEGPIHTLREFAPGLLERGGQIAVTASSAGLGGEPGSSYYAAAKFGLVGLAESLAMEWRGRGVRVSIVCPSSVATGIKDRQRCVPPEGVPSDLWETANRRRHEMFHRGAMSPERAAARIVDGIARRKLYVFNNPWVRLGWIWKTLFPRWNVRFMWHRNRLLWRRAGLASGT